MSVDNKRKRPDHWNPLVAISEVRKSLTSSVASFSSDLNLVVVEATEDLQRIEMYLEEMLSEM